MNETYVKKPIAIQAFQWDPQAVPADLPGWFWNVFGLTPELFNEATGVVTIRTLEGDMNAKPGDYIARGVKGELYPIRQDIFEETYDRSNVGIGAWASYCYSCAMSGEKGVMSFEAFQEYQSSK